MQEPVYAWSTSGIGAGSSSNGGVGRQRVGRVPGERDKRRLMMTRQPTGVVYEIVKDVKPVE
jgi:hypothetical protein